MDEVARSRALARDVRFEVSVDVVLQLAVERPSQQSLEVLQTMRVVGQTEFTGKNKQIQIPPNRMILLCLTAVRESQTIKQPDCEKRAERVFWDVPLIVVSP